ncbi:MAG: HAD family phosphatase [Clostridia bacterium]|nr:HAD family phosphatase [Clostridia bacterium]
MSIRAVAFDLDDTLLRSDSTISDYTVDVLHRAAAQGVHIIPASGRTSVSMWKAIPRILDIGSCFVSCNGAEVWAPDRTLMMQELLPVSLAHEVARFAAERGIYCQTYAPDRFFYTIENEWASSYSQLSSLEGECVGDLTAFIRKPVTKLLMMDDPARVAHLLQEAKALFGDRASLTCSKPYFLECNPQRATKGAALGWCAKHFGFTMDELVCFGDSLNDVSMLQAAGTGVVVANARTDVKALGFTLCRSNDEDGVAHYIDEHILIH